MANYDNQYGTSRRNFLKFGATLAGAAALKACSPFEKMPETLEPSYLRFVKETIDSLAGSAPSTTEATDWEAHKAVLGDKYAAALNWLQRANTAASGLVKGQKLHLRRTMYSIAGDKNTLAESQGLEGEAKTRTIENFVSGLNQSLRDVLTDAYTARDQLKDALTAYDANKLSLAEVRSKVSKNEFPELSAKINALFSAYEGNAKQIQANLRAQTWLNVSEARYAHTGSDLGLLIAIDDSLEKSQSRAGFIDQGRAAYNKLEVVDGGKTMSLGEYKNRKVDNTAPHFAQRDRNFEHDVILDSRVPVARKIFGAFNDGKLSLAQAQGAYHVLDVDIDTMSRTPVEGKSFIRTIWDWLPFEQAATLVEDSRLWGASNAPTGTEAQILRETSEGYLGWPMSIAGKENIAGRDALAVLILALWGGAIYGGVRANSGSSSSGTSGQGIGGGQTGGPGLR